MHLKGFTKPGQPTCTPICLNGIISAFQIHVLEHEPIQQGSGCLSNKLESNLRILICPFCSYRKVFKEGKTRSRFNYNNYTSMTDINWVTQNVCEEPTPSSRKSGSSARPSRKTPPSNSTKLPKSSGLGHFKEGLQAGRISKGLQPLL